MPLLHTRRHCDKGDSTLVTFVLVVPLFLMFVMTTMDTSMYFSNRATIQQIARDGARQVAIFGGSGTATARTPLEASYGGAGACRTVQNAASRTGDQTQVECSVLANFEAGGAGLSNVTVTKVECGPGRVDTPGGMTYCDVSWTYGGMPGSTLSYIRNGEGESPLQTNRTRVTARAEVSLTGVALVGR